MFNSKKDKQMRRFTDSNGDVYYINLERLKEVCLTQSLNGGSKETELTNVYNKNDMDVLELESKVEHETKIYGNSQNDMIVYDIVKTMLTLLMDIEDDELSWSFGELLCINTLLEWGILEVEHSNN